MAKRKKKKVRAKAPSKALLRKRAKSVPGGAHKIKPRGKRKEKRSVANPGFLIEKDGNLLLKLNELGEQIFSIGGNPSDYVIFPTKEAAGDGIFSEDPVFAGASVVPFNKYFGLSHYIDINGDKPKLAMDYTWLVADTKPVSYKAAVKAARAKLMELKKAALQELKANEKEAKACQNRLNDFDKWFS